MDDDRNYITVENDAEIIIDEDAWYSTGDVSRILGNVSRDMVRRYMKEFQSFLELDIAESGHTRLRGKDMDLMRTIVMLRKERKEGEVKALLRDPSLRVLLVGSSPENQKRLDDMLKNNEILLQGISSLLSELLPKYLEQFELKQIHLLEQKDEENEKLLKEIQYLKEKNEEENKKVEQILSMLQEQEEQRKKEKKGIFSWFKG